MSWAKRDWTDVRPDDYVQSPRDGQPWLVVSRDTFGAVTVRNATMSQQNIGKMSGPVWIWDAAMEAGVGVLAQHLGARVVGDTAERKD